MGATEHTEPHRRAVSTAPLLHEELTGVIRQTAFEAHAYFGKGFLEKVYANALANRLRRKGLVVEQRRGLNVYDEDGALVGEYFADLLVNSCVIVEIKAAKTLAPEHVAQLLNYLKASGLHLGVLVNFGASRLEFRRFVFGAVLRCDSACSVAQPNSLAQQRCDQ